MIEKMKTVSLVCLKNDQENALKQLRELKLMHVKPISVQGSRKLSDVQRELDGLTRMINLLSGKEADEEKPGELDADELIEKVRELNTGITKAQEEWDMLARHEEALIPWGEFDPTLITELRDAGMDVRLCIASSAKIPELPEGAALQEINRIGDMVYFLILSRETLTEELPEALLPMDNSLSQIREQKAKLEEIIEKDEKQLAILANAIDKLEEKKEAVMDDEEFISNMERMGIDESLCTITGYVADKHVEKLKTAAMDHGWALQIDDPAEEDLDVPTMITVPKWLNISKPLFDFVGITPGYREFDVSAWFLIFFTIFFAIIVGDGGYGAIFLVGTFIARAKADANAKVAVNLLMLLSFCTLVWGFLTGNFFGIDPELMPAFMRGIPYFTGENAQANTQFVCFLIGAIHLSIGHGIKLSAVINSTMALAQAGWIAIIWGYFFVGSNLVAGTVFPEFAKYLLIGGTAAVILFSVPTKNFLKLLGGGLGEFMGGIVNSFVDVLSYIRLFAVGLSSYYVALSFNDMGVGIGSGGSGAMAIPLIAAGALVIVFGHILNIALCGLSVLVHGIRLNTLEFSGHVGLEWAGIPFRAFRKRVN